MARSKLRLPKKQDCLPKTLCSSSGFSMQTDGIKKAFRTEKSLEHKNTNSKVATYGHDCVMYDDILSKLVSPQTQHLRIENQNLKENMERLRNEIAEIRHVVLLC
ncbi:hypothetical protein YC2023_020814 [Brassica napus]